MLVLPKFCDKLFKLFKLTASTILPPPPSSQHTAESPMTQEAADRIKEAEMKKPNPDYEFIRRTQEAAKRNEGK